MGDDMGYADIGCDAGEIETPVLDGQEVLDYGPLLYCWVSAGIASFALIARPWCPRRTGAFA